MFFSGIGRKPPGLADVLDRPDLARTTMNMTGVGLAHARARSRTLVRRRITVATHPRGQTRSMRPVTSGCPRKDGPGGPDPVDPVTDFWGTAAVGMKKLQKRPGGMDSEVS